MVRVVGLTGCVAAMIAGEPVRSESLSLQPNARLQSDNWSGWSVGNYIGDDAFSGRTDLANWAIHGQTTFVEQYAAPFRAPYRGQNSLGPNQARETVDATAYLGVRPWQGAEIWLNPEIDQGFGLSGTLGVAGFLSGEAYKKGAEYPYARLHRAFIRQTIDLGGETQTVDAAINQFAMKQTPDRLVLTAGKYSVGDISTPTDMRTTHAAIFSIGRSSTQAPSITRRKPGATR